ncbi:MAG: transposase [Bdellovibrionales bacterium]|nr:transposase [Bdellovibrionales bacterium]
MKAKQSNLFDYFDTRQTRLRYGRTHHGGVETKGHRKLERPLSTTRPIHLVLKSHKAKGSLSFLTHQNKPVVETIIREKARKFGVRICQFANVGNHLHLKIRIASRPLFQAFLVSVTTLIARTLTGARRGKKFGRFWQGQAFTRVLVSRREELNLFGYIKANQIEGRGSTEARELYLEKFHRWVYRERLRGKSLENFKRKFEVQITRLQV